MIKFYDTNAILELQEKVLEDEEKFYISDITLLELESIKTSRNKDEETKFKARKAVRILDENEDKYYMISYGAIEAGILERMGLEDTPDNKICACAYNMNRKVDVLLVTNDLCCRLIASACFGLTCQKGEASDIERYKGYVDKTLDDVQLAYFYEHQNENIFNLEINEYLIIRNPSGEITDIRRWTGEYYTGLNSKTYKSNALGSIKPLDEIQKCAMDSISNNDITVLYGRAGSGKTILPLGYIMQNLEKEKIRKCYIIYSYEPLRGAQTLGWEKGDHVTKLLYYSSIGEILATKFGDMNQVEYYMEKGILDIVPTANIRGVEFGENDCVFCTECQNLDVYTLKTIVQRCKSGCKQIYEGDIIEQKDKNIGQIGMDRLIDVFKGHERFGCVKLKNNYRSELCELADLM